MKAKGFFITVITGVLACFGVLILLLSVEDPFFVMGGIGEGETARFNNQRYQMAGLIRHQEYSAVVMGTSMVANFRASWFTEGLGEETLKITFPDGWISEFDTALRLAFRTHPGLKRVYFCLDPNILIRPDSQRTVELPWYLYNLNPLDDVEYLLNADTYQEAMRSFLRRGTDEMVPLDDAFLWTGSHGFSRAWALVSYPRPEVSEAVLPDDAFLDAVAENLDVVCRWFEEFPDVEFVVWFPPYSILYWDKTTREGTADAVLTAVEAAGERLLEYDNLELYSFLYSKPITVLDYYADHIHCSGGVTYWQTQCMLTGDYRFTAEGLRAQLKTLRDFVHAYDFEALFDP